MPLRTGVPRIMLLPTEASALPSIPNSLRIDEERRWRRIPSAPGPIGPHMRHRCPAPQPCPLAGRRPLTGDAAAEPHFGSRQLGRHPQHSARAMGPAPRRPPSRFPHASIASRRSIVEGTAHFPSRTACSWPPAASPPSMVAATAPMCAAHRQARAVGSRSRRPDYAQIRPQQLETIVDAPDGRQTGPSAGVTACTMGTCVRLIPFGNPAGGGVGGRVTCSRDS